MISKYIVYIEGDKYAFIEAIPELYSRVFHFHNSRIIIPFIDFYKLLRVPLVQWDLFGLLLLIKTFKKKKKTRRKTVGTASGNGRSTRLLYFIWWILYYVLVKSMPWSRGTNWVLIMLYICVKCFNTFLICILEFSFI